MLGPASVQTELSLLHYKGRSTAMEIIGILRSQLESFSLNFNKQEGDNQSTLSEI